MKHVNIGDRVIAKNVMYLVSVVGADRRIITYRQGVFIGQPCLENKGLGCQIKCDDGTFDMCAPSDMYKPS